MEFLLKLSIQRADTMKLLTLATVINSFAELEITNPTLLSITKEILLNTIDRKSNIEDPMMLAKSEDIKPNEITQFMTAFCRAQIFDVHLMEALESQFISQIDQAEAPSLVTMFTSHGAWAAH
jgi:hypothetical protein